MRREIQDDRGEAKGREMDEREESKGIIVFLFAM